MKTKAYFDTFLGWFICGLALLLLIDSVNAQSSVSVGNRLQELELAQRMHQLNLDTIWVFVSGSLVFFMNAGFAMLEAGFCRRKNSITVLAKNLLVFCLATVAFGGLGFGLMFGDGNDWFGTSGFLPFNPADNSPAIGANYQGVFSSLNWVAVPLSAKLFFHLTFAGTAATIVSGAIAERVKFIAFLLFTPLLVGIAYPITGHWVWGGGWLAKLGFWDFAGSTVVHSVGGWAGLVGSLYMGPRIGKFTPIAPDQHRQLSFEKRSTRSALFGDRGAMQINILPAENLSLSTLGCLILWVGWFGFNAGSVFSANGLAISHILMNTILAGSLGGLGAMVCGWLYFTKPNLSFMINGILAGCVSITAPCAFVDGMSASLIGFCGGALVVASKILLDKLLIDDPVGAIAVHLFCGIWGTFSVGLFSEGPFLYPKYGISTGPGLGVLKGGGLDVLWPQMLGILAIGGFTVVFSVLVWALVKKILGNSLRVNREQELLGLDGAFEDSVNDRVSRLVRESR